MQISYGQTVKGRFFGAALIGVFFTSAGLRAELAQPALSSEFLQQVEWNDLESVERIASNASLKEPVPGKERIYSDPDLILVRSGQLEIDGFIFEVNIQEYENTGLHRVILTSGAGERRYRASERNMEFCSRRVAMFQSQFGKTQKSYDVSRPTSLDSESVDIRAQWDIGATRIDFKCYAIRMYEGFIPLFILSYGHQSTIDSLVLPINVVCSVNERNLGPDAEGQIYQKQPFAITILDGEQKVIGSTKFGQVQHFSDRRILFSDIDEEKDIESSFDLDRVSGIYEHRIQYTDDSPNRGYGILRWGDCKRVSADSKL